MPVFESQDCIFAFSLKRKAQCCIIFIINKINVYFYIPCACKKLYPGVFSIWYL